MRTLVPRTVALLATALLTASAPFTAARAQLPIVSLLTNPDRVEEDWQLVIANPDPIGVGPQITTVMSPTGNPSDPFVAFDMNYQEYPSFTAGGVQVQVWSGSNVISTASQGSSLFNTTGETLTWTQQMSLSGGRLTYDIDNGQSVTWGKFGQGAQLSVSYPTQITSLAGYTPSDSASRSGASWESNFVTSLKITQVRYYANGQLIWTDTNPKILIAPGTN